jgi:hypothetical protein
MTLVFDFYRHDFPIAVVLTLFFLVAVCWVIGAIWLGHEQQKADDRARKIRSLEAACQLTEMLARQRGRVIPRAPGHPSRKVS